MRLERRITFLGIPVPFTRRELKAGDPELLEKATWNRKRHLRGRRLVYRDTIGNVWHQTHKRFEGGEYKVVEKRLGTPVEINNAKIKSKGIIFRKTYSALHNTF